MHHTRNTLSQNVRAKSIELLNKHLAAAIDLQAQIKQAHWNVRGPGFIGVHELFDQVSTAVLGHIDVIAERAGALGGVAHGTVQVSAQRSFLVPYPLGIADVAQHVAAVSGALAAFGESTRQAIDEAGGAGDQATADLFTAVTRDIDQQLWLVESQLLQK